MAEWNMMAIIHALVGYEAVVLGFVNSSGDDASTAMLIIAFLVYTVAIILIALSYFGDVSGMAVDISTIVLMLVAGLFAIIGVGLWGSGDANADSLQMCLECTGALMALLAGIFLILKMVGVGAPSVGGGGGGGGDKKAKRGRSKSPKKVGRGRGRGRRSRSRSSSRSRSRSRSPPGRKGRNKTGPV